MPLDAKFCLQLEDESPLVCFLSLYSTEVVMVRRLTFPIKYGTKLVTAKLVWQATYFLSDFGLLFLKFEEQSKTREISRGNDWSIFVGMYLLPDFMDLVSKLCIEPVDERVVNQVSLFLVFPSIGRSIGICLNYVFTQIGPCSANLPQYLISLRGTLQYCSNHDLIIRKVLPNLFVQIQ